MTAENTVPIYLLAFNEALLACSVSIPSAEHDPSYFSWFITEKEKENRLADMGLSMKAFSSGCHQQQMASGDIAAVTSGLQAATSA